MPVDALQPTAQASSDDPQIVRRMALQILRAIDQRGQTLDETLEDFRQNHPLARQRDRALLQTLVFGVLRWRGRIDFVIATFSRTPLNKIQPDILNILRMALFQVMFLDRIPASAAVNTAVELAKPLAPIWVVRFVNALLRKAATGYQKVRFPVLEQNPVAALAALKSFPTWLIRRWLYQFNSDETAALCDAINTIPPVTLRANTLKVHPEMLLKTLTDDGESVLATSMAPEALLLRHPQKPIEEFNVFQRGWFQVQDEAAQFVTILLDPQPGERVLDACAGLGGKTGHIAQRMQNSGIVVALDVNAAKLKRLMTEMERLGISIVRPYTVDLSSGRLSANHGPYDRILLDAPCSGLGVLRRNPDAKWYVKETALDGCGRRQVEFLNRLAVQLKPGGVLVYAVCSSEPEEGEAVVAAFMKNHPDYRLENAADYLPHLVGTPLTRDNFFKTYPHRHGSDGFFAARFRRMP
ncbi:MAG: 16S rRNA (cytosine(967)-C(5))-methyltransferase RsmB [Desulfobacterales bacterium]|jgi:16S rRNA (cytosine967-C5)-methyltransferase